MQTVLVVLVFLAALAWLSRTFWLQWFAKPASACKGGCGCETSKLVKAAQAAKAAR